MSNQVHKFGSHKRLGMTNGVVRSKSVLAGVAVMLMCASFVFTGGVSAHNIDLKKAREAAREFAQAIRQQSNGTFLHYSTKCSKMFPGHNHLVKCEIEYQNAKDTAAGVYTCKEVIQVYFDAHTRSAEAFEVHIRHTSKNICGGLQPGVTYF